jgi:hypothetical protein
MLSTRRHLIHLCISFLTLPGITLAEETAARSKFIDPSVGRSGWVNIASPEGQYIYGHATSGRGWTRAFTIGSEPRKDYEFFSFQEEEALWLVMQDQIDAMQPPQIHKKKGRARVDAQKINWPRVVLRDGEVCVPVVEKSDADDWKDHLTCTEVSRNDQ